MLSLGKVLVLNIFFIIFDNKNMAVEVSTFRENFFWQNLFSVILRLNKNQILKFAMKKIDRR